MPTPINPIEGAIRLVAGSAAFAALLFAAAGTLAWPAAWACLATITAVMVVYGLIIVRLHPELIEERRHPPADAKPWDKPFIVIVGMVGMTFSLGSRPALAAAVALCLVLARRTALEDRTLRAELNGYDEYARRVRFRLVPGVW